MALAHASMCTMHSAMLTDELPRRRTAAAATAPTWGHRPSSLLLASQLASLQKKKLAVFVSGGGSNFKAIQAAIAEGTVHGEVVAVVSNAPSCGGAEFARAHGIPVLTYPAPKADPAAGLTADQLVQQLTQVGGPGRPLGRPGFVGRQWGGILPHLLPPRPPARICLQAGPCWKAAPHTLLLLFLYIYHSQDFQVDYVILAGYLKLIPSQLCRAFRRRILNIHPGLLPSFGGKGYYGIKVGGWRCAQMTGRGLSNAAAVPVSSVRAAVSASTGGGTGRMLHWLG